MLRLLNWYLSYYPMDGTNRNFVLFYRNRMGWPECCFADVIDHIRQFVVDKAAHGGTEMLACQLTDGSVIPVIP
jgi:hypothetical protein